MPIRPNLKQRFGTTGTPYLDVQGVQNVWDTLHVIELNIDDGAHHLHGHKNPETRCYTAPLHSFGNDQLSNEFRQENDRQRRVGSQNHTRKHRISSKCARATGNVKETAPQNGQNTGTGNTASHTPEQHGQ
jgi:hypothetical protein